MVKNSSEKHIHLVPSFHYDIEYLLPEGPYLEVSLRNLVEAQNPSTYVFVPTIFNQELTDLR